MINESFAQQQWSAKLKFSFYCIFIYLCLYTFPFPIDWLVGVFQRFFRFVSEITGWKFLIAVADSINIFFGFWDEFWHWLIPIFSKNVLRLEKPITDFPGGSGDTTFNYVQLLLNLILSFIGGFIWLFMAKQRKNHTRLYQLLITGLRYYVAIMMLSYGFAKVIQNQFSYPYLARLIQPYGESSPMGLAWTFMGYSKGYNFFTGMAEVIGGLFLFFRCTKTFGALFTMTVCTTIFVMNLCYDIPVKLFSFHLLLFATFIAMQDCNNLVAFFFKNKPAQLIQSPFYFEHHKKARWFRYLKWFMVFFLFYTNYTDNKKQYDKDANFSRTVPLYGIYNAECKIVNADTIPLIYKDTNNWKQLIISSSGAARIRLLNDSLRRLTFRVDTSKNEIIYFPSKDSTTKFNFKYTIDNGLLSMYGKIKTDSVILKFTRFNEEKYLLNSRGFNWINETPYNR
jgi:hypothetical protein